MSNAINKLSISGHPALPDFEWDQVPQLAILSGINGSGKTKLLDAINLRVTNQQELKRSGAFQIQLDCKIDEREYGYIPWQQRLGRIERGYYADMQKDLDTWISEVQRNRINSTSNRDLWQILRILQDMMGESPLDKTEAYYRSQEFIDKFRVAWAYAQDITLNKYISRLFVNYQIRREETIMRSYNGRSGSTVTEQKITEDIGIPPWDLINDLFIRYGFKYRINKPRGSHDPYDVKFTPAENDSTQIRFEHLSSGEQMIVTLILWSFNEEMGQLKKILLLDEPDAHLHPEMALMFKEIMCDILVNKFDMQIILTTHSPTTLCWFPEESVFLMERERGVVKATKQEALSTLTSGLVFVHEAFKIILVEDKDDQLFHQSVYDALVYSGCITDRTRLKFRSVKTAKINSGGKSNVIAACSQWNNFADGTEIAGLINGLVDRDHDDPTSLPDTVRAFSRYCYENYLADPLVIFTLLVEERHQQTEDYARSLEYIRGDEYKFKTNQIENPQGIVDYLLQKILNSPDSGLSQNDMSNRVLCKYVNGVEVHLPKKLLDESGKDYGLALYKRAFPEEASTMNRHKLSDQLIKTHLVPVELKELYEQLAGSGE